MKPQYLPDKLRLFVLNSATRNVAQGVTLSATINLIVEAQRLNDPKQPIQVSRNNDIHLGVLASDHAGYISFDVKPFKKFLPLLYKALANTNSGTIITMKVNSIRVSSPYADFSQELLSYLTDIDEDAVEFFNSFKPNAISVLVPPDLSFLSNPSLRGLQPIQNTDVLDWKTSPDSFGMAGLAAIGEGGCETLLPSQSSDRIFRFFQIKRFPSVNNETLTGADGSTLEYKRGKLIEYEMLWHPINHGLGQIQYSLTLAPGEGTKIAIIEWDRKDESVRSERTGLKESLLHEQKHSRIVDEAVEAAIKEYQRGKSFMGGTAGVGGYGSQGSGSMWGVTGSHSLGVSDSSSEGDRTMESQSIQQLSDIVAQASSSLRDLRSTVIVQANQSEREALQTRSIRNYNHSHALTILYYEVVRHYCLITRAVKKQDLIFIKYNTYDFTKEIIKKYQKILLENLTDRTLTSAFDLLEQEEFQPVIIKKFIVSITSPVGGDQDVENDRVHFRIIDTSGIKQWKLDDEGYYLQPKGADETKLFNKNTNTFVIDLDTAHEFLGYIDVTSIYNIGINLVAKGDSRWTIKGMTVLALIGNESDNSNDRIISLFENDDINHHFEDDGDIWFGIQSPILETVNGLKSEKSEKLKRLADLISHLNDNKIFYSTILHLNETAEERMIRFDNLNYQITMEDGSIISGRLADFIHPQPVELLGNYIAFKLGEIKSVPDEEIEPAERIISLPTRGLFAEAQLSHCNASEIFDDSRFWDWQISPIPDEAPEISGVSPTSRYRDIISNPTGLPNNSVGIEGAPDAPNPSALSQIIDAVTKSDIFRDMSAKAELASILNEITKAAAGVEQQRMQSLTELGKQDAETERARMQAQSENSSNGGGGGNSGTGTGSTGSTPAAGGDTTPTSTGRDLAAPYGEGTLTPREASSYYELNERTASTQEDLEEGRDEVRDRTVIGGTSTVTVDLKYGTQDLHGSFSVTCFNRSTSRSDDTNTRNRRTASSQIDSSSLSLSIPRSWSTVNVVVTINSLIFLNISLVDTSASADFQRLITSRSRSGSIFDMNAPDSGNRLYEYTHPISISEVINLRDTISRNLVCRYSIQSESIVVERTTTTGREEEWNFSGNVGFENKVVLGISGGNTSSETHGESTTIRRTMTIRYIDPSQPRITQGREE